MKNISSCSEKVQFIFNFEPNESWRRSDKLKFLKKNWNLRNKCRASLLSFYFEKRKNYENVGGVSALPLLNCNGNWPTFLRARRRRKAHAKKASISTSVAELIYRKNVRIFCPAGWWNFRDFVKILTRTPREINFKNLKKKSRTSEKLLGN